MSNRRTILQAVSLAPWLLTREASASEAPPLRKIKTFIVGANYPAFPERASKLELHNAVKDAQTMEASLARTVSPADRTFFANPSVEEWRTRLAKYRERASPGDFTVFYYAGHAFQSGAEQAFLCNDGISAVSAEQVLRLLLRDIRGVFFIVDACRAPLAQVLRQSVSIQDLQLRGVRLNSNVTMSDVDPDVFRTIEPAEMALPQARAIQAAVSTRVKFLYSTDGGQLASDGPPGRGGVFARIAAREIAQHADLDTVVRKIIDKVRSQTEGTGHPQTPAQAGGFSDLIYIAGPRRNS